MVPGKDGTIRDACRYVRGAGGGLGGRDAGGVFTIVPYAKTVACYYEDYFTEVTFSKEICRDRSRIKTDFEAVFYFELCGPR